MIQSVLIDKNIYSLDEALEFIIDNNYKHDKVDITENYYRFRQKNPSIKHNYITKQIYKGIKLIITV